MCQIPARYIGQTGCKLKQNLEEHKRGCRTADFNSSALAEHAWTNDHSINWSSVKVLANPRDYRTRLVQEAFLIRTITGTINRDGGTLPVEYENLVRQSSSYFFPSFTVLRHPASLVSLLLFA